MKPKEVRNPPKPTRFKYPEGTILKGTVIKEVGNLYETEDHGDYYFVIQLIDYGDEEMYVRFGYYRKKPGGNKFGWGSQTTFHTDKDFANKLIKKAKNKGIL